MLNVWYDVNDDGLGTRPFKPADVLNTRDARSFRPEDIGYLTTPVDTIAWKRDVRNRFSFPNDLDHTITSCNPGDRYLADKLRTALTTPDQ